MLKGAGTRATCLVMFMIVSSLYMMGVQGDKLLDHPVVANARIDLVKGRAKNDDGTAKPLKLLFWMTLPGI